MNPQKLFREYVVTIAATDEPDTWHLLEMLVQMRAMLDAGEHLKLCRWTGYVQRWLEEKRLRTLDQLRDETRGLDAALAATVSAPVAAPTVKATEIPAVDPHRLAKTIYEAYASDRGWTTDGGKQMPQWSGMGYGDKSHWLAVADAVLDLKAA